MHIIAVSNSNNRKNDEQKCFINMIIIINKRKGGEKRTAGIWRDKAQANQKRNKHNSQSLFAYADTHSYFSVFMMCWRTMRTNGKENNNNNSGALQSSLILFNARIYFVFIRLQFFIIYSHYVFLVCSRYRPKNAA